MAISYNGNSNIEAVKYNNNPMDYVYVNNAKVWVRRVKVTFVVSPTSYGSVTETSMDVPIGTSYSVNGNTLTIGADDIRANPKPRDSYVYRFKNWSIGSGAITNGVINTPTTVYANFEREPYVAPPIVINEPSGTADDPFLELVDKGMFFRNLFIDDVPSRYDLFERVLYVKASGVIYPGATYKLRIWNGVRDYDWGIWNFTSFSYPTADTNLYCIIIHADGSIDVFFP